MAQNFADLMVNGGGRVEFIWHPLGLPWSVSTHSDLGAALSNDDKEAMFGHAVFTVDATQCRPGRDGVSVWPVLQRPGSYTIDYHEKNGWFTGGDWSVVISREPLGATYTHRSGTIWGLEGLDTCPDDRIDPSICRARLSRNLLDGSATLYFNDDTGGRLVAKIAANFATDTPTYIWIGTECMAIWKDTDQVGCATGEYRIDAGVARAIWRTNAEEHHVEDWDGSSVLISDAPLGGITGRAAALWAIPLDAGGTRIGAPVQVTEGQINPGIKGKPGATWNISCQPEWNFLNQKIRAGSPTMQMKGYTLSRCPDMTGDGLTWDHDFVDQAPHIWIHEWNGSAYESKEIWLCAEGDSKYFKTYSKLLAAVEVEMGKLSAADGTAYSATVDGGATVENYLDNYYKITNRGPEKISTSELNSSIMSGVLPWVCGWGAFKVGEEMAMLNRHGLGQHEYFSKNSEIAANNLAPHLGCYNTGDSAIDTDWGPYDLAAPNGLKKYRSRFLVQYKWETRALCTANPDLNAFPIPDPTATEYDLYPQADYDATKFANDAILQVGNPEHVGMAGRPMVGYGKVASTGDNYVRMSTDDPYASDIEGSVPVGPDGGASIKTIDFDEKPFGKGFCLFSVPAAHNNKTICEVTGTRWLMTDQKVIRAESFVKLLRGLLNADTDATSIGGRFVLSNVPDGHSSDIAWPGDHLDMFDWDQLETMTTIDALEDVYWEVVLDDDFNVLDLLRNVLLFCHAQPTREFRGSVNRWVIGFKPMATINATEAWLSGRIMDSTVRVFDNVPEEYANNTWLFGDVKAKFHYSVVHGKFMITVPARNLGGRRSPGGEAGTLKIEDKATHLEGGEEASTDSELVQQISEYHGELLRKVEWPSPVFAVKCTTGSILSTAVGRECLLTDTTAREPFKGAQGLTNQAALVVSQTIDWGKPKPGVINKVRVSPLATYGIAPAMIIPANVGGGTTYMTLVGTTLTVGNLPITAATSQCAVPTGNVTDLFYFDCLVYNAATDTIEANALCTCGDYEIIIWDRGAGGSAFDEATPNRNFWTGSIGSVDVDTGACVIALDNADDFSVSTAKVVKFNDLDTAGLQPCQEYYLVFGDEDGEIVDQDAVTKTAGSLV